MKKLGGKMQEKIEILYEKVNPEEIIFKLKSLIKLTGGENGRNEFTSSYDITN